jgi:TolB protein
MRRNAIIPLLLLVTAGCADDELEQQPGNTELADRGDGEGRPDAGEPSDDCTDASIDAAADAGGGPGWPDGHEILFEVQDGSFPDLDRDLFVLDLDDGNVTDFLVADTFDNQAVWSPDGERVALSRTADGNSDIHVMSPEGTSRLTTDPAADLFPAWSPDGQQIAWYSDRGGDPAIYVMNADGSEQIKLVSTGGWTSEPTWSPDGARIAFDAWLGDDEFSAVRIWVIGVDGSGLDRLGPDPDLDDQFFDEEPAWSPDGTRIAYVSDRAQGSDYEVFVMNADGTGRVQLTDLTGASGYSVDPAWSPDSTRIVYTTDRGGPDYDLHVIDAGGGPELPLTDTPADESRPSWR